SRRGGDLKYDTEITLEDAFRGVQMPLTFERTEVCHICKGSGAKPGSGLKRCKTCRGAGRIQFAQGFFALTQTCPDCAGQGEVVEIPCKECGGSGRERKKVTLNIRVPAGIQEGSTLRVQHAGEAGTRGGDIGDLYVQVHLKHHSVFEREGDDLLYNCGISFPQASLGCQMEIPGIDGNKSSLDIPAGTQYGAVFRIQEKGMTKLGGKKRGDLLARVKIEVPHNLEPRQKELMEELARSFEEEYGGVEDGGFFKKVFGSSK
ncbi:MAG TPA: DnaJ C-terminal domain-containing protein, partial [bacterium]|nr:DnaJ C-terminal domain-containing protein [bacterium]